MVRPPADGDVESLLAQMREASGLRRVEVLLARRPGTAERLRAAGLEPGEEETVVVAEAASILPAPDDVDLRSDPQAFVRARRVPCFGRGNAIPESSEAVVASSTGSRWPADGSTSSGEGLFAGLFGGLTLPDHRGRGLYRATVAKRAELARERGYRWLYSDALPTSRPILERVGFVAITTTTPFVFPRA